ncbi:MAG: MFS transporter [Ilumatobacteraceae bacterium]
MTDSAPPGAGRLPRPFHLLWTATAVSNIGDGLRLTALPLLATSITTDPRAIAGVAIAERVPWLVFILPGGAWADRFDRRALRMRLDTARALVMAGLLVAISFDRVTLAAIYAVAALLASAEAVVDSSSMAIVPSTVHERDLERAGSRLSSTELVTNGLIGPPLGGLLFGAAVIAPFAVDAASFAAAAIIMSLLPGRFRPDTNPSEQQASMRHQIAEGFRWFWSRRALRNLALISTALGFSGFVGGSVFVLFATQTLGLSSVGYGLLIVPSAFGGVAGSILAPKLTALPLPLVLAASTVISGAATWTMSASSTPALVAMLTALSTAAVIVWNILTVALRQRIIPDHLLGRVGASSRFLVYSGMPFGALTGGILADSFGIRTALAINGIGLVAIGVLVPHLLRGIQPSSPSNTPA